MVLRLGCNRRRGSERDGTQDECIAARRDALEDTEARVIDDRMVRHLGKVAAHEREMVPFVDAADAAQPLDRLCGGRQAAERVARVGRIGDQAAPAHNFRRAANEPELRIGGMDGEELRHQRARNSSISFATASG